MFSEEEIDLITAQFQTHYGFVSGIIYRYAPMKDLMGDIMQEVFIDFFTGFAEKKWSLGQEGIPTDWRPLLGHLAKRRSQLFARQQKRKKRLVDLVAERLQQKSRESDKAKSLAEVEQKMQAMKQCLAKLPPKSRAIVEQYYFERVSMGRIAEHQGTTLATIRNFFYRIRLKLRQCIETSAKKDDR